MSVRSDSNSGIQPTRDQVLAEVKRIVGDQMGIAPEKIRQRDQLINDLGCDSLDVTEISIEAEEHFGVTVPDELAQHSLTVGEIVNGLLQLLGQPIAD
jgi:acyl carrier protein